MSNLSGFVRGSGVWLGLVVACGPVPDDASGSEGGAADGSSAGTGEVVPTGGPGTSGEPTGTGAATTSGPMEPADDPCLQFSAGDCPAGCEAATPIRPADDPCEFDGGLDPLCVTVGPAFPAEFRTTFFGTLGGETVLLLGGDGCVGVSGPAMYWHECTNSGDEPAQCGCLCGTGGCPFNLEVEALDACHPTICEGYDVVLGAYSDATICALQAARDRTPGRLAWRTVTVSSARIHRMYVAGEEVQFTGYTPPDSCPDPLAGKFNATQRCLLNTPAFFEACLQAFSEECNDVSTWVTGCATMPGSCP